MQKLIDDLNDVINESSIEKRAKLVKSLYQKNICEFYTESPFEEEKKDEILYNLGMTIVDELVKKNCFRIYQYEDPETKKIFLKMGICVVYRSEKDAE